MHDNPPRELVCRECDYIDKAALPGALCPTHACPLVDPQSLGRYRNDPHLGRSVAGKYAVVSVLGVGGFGAVYLAVQSPVGRQVALKLVRDGHLKDPLLRARFFREARAVARLNDPAVVTLFDYGEEDDGGLYIAFELVRGRTLQAIIDSGPQDAVWSVHILLQALRALAEAHHLGLIHRDIKPGNIMVVRNQFDEDNVRLLDFGIAKLQSADDLPDASLDDSLETREGVVMGTPKYMPPEQARSQHVDARSDLYALGAVAYALLNGAPPFDRRTALDTVLAHVSETPPPLPPERGVAPALEAVIMRALEKDPAARYQSAGEMMLALQAVYPGVSFPSASFEMSAIRRAAVSGEMIVTGLPFTPTPSSGTSTEMAATIEAGPELTASVSASGRRRSPALFATGLAIVAAAWWTQRDPVASSTPIETPARAAIVPTPPAALAPIDRARALAAAGRTDEAAITFLQAVARARARGGATAVQQLIDEARTETAFDAIFARPEIAATVGGRLEAEAVTAEPDATATLAIVAEPPDASIPPVVEAEPPVPAPAPVENEARRPGLRTAKRSPAAPARRRPAPGDGLDVPEF